MMKKKRMINTALRVPNELGENMKVLFCSDLHLGLVVGGYDMRDDTIKVLKKIQADVNQQDVELVVVGGDVFHTSRPSPQAYADAFAFLTGIPCPVVVFRGNHDETNGLSTDALEPFRHAEWGPQYSEEGGSLDFFEMYNSGELYASPVFVIDGPGVLKFGVREFLFAPFMSNARAVSQGHESAQAAINSAFKQARSSKNLMAAFCHLDVDGAQSGSEGLFLRGGELQIPNRGSKLLACPVIGGHIHRRQKIGENIYLPGSVVPTDFGDADGPKGYAILEV
jgi:exonuclease SbcD